QFFGKVNDPDTAKYYERFFEIIKMPTHSISKSSGLSFESRITKGEKEVAKRRADVFFRLKQGQFVALADGKDKKVQFKLQKIQRGLPNGINEYSKADLEENFERIYNEVRSIFK